MLVIADNNTTSSACNETWTFCSPHPNETWYEYNYYRFIINQNIIFEPTCYSNTEFINNNITLFNIHFITLSITNTSVPNRKIKSWYNITSSSTPTTPFQVTDDWFPSPLASNATNITWTTELVLTYPNASGLDESPEPKATNSIQFYVVQTASKTAPIIPESHTFAPWLIVVIVIATISIVILVICIIIWLKNKKAQQQLRRNSILSTPDALMIADTFRQVMDTPDKTKNQIGQDILNRRLTAEGTNVLEVERRTSSTRNKKKLLK